MLLDEFNRRRQARSRQQQLAEDIQYRQNLREMNSGKRRIRAMVDSYAAQAVEAEREGRHDQAVRLALEARRLKRYLASSGSIGDALESAHAVGAANRALTNILEASGGLMDRAARMMDPVALGEAQASAQLVSENMRLMMEQSDMLMDDMGDDGGADDGAGEAFLREIMRREHADKQNRLIQDTNRQLDRLSRARAADK